MAINIGQNASTQANKNAMDAAIGAVAIEVRQCFHQMQGLVSLLSQLVDADFTATLGYSAQELAYIRGVQSDYQKLCDIRAGNGADDGTGHAKGSLAVAFDFTSHDRYAVGR